MQIFHLIKVDENMGGEVDQICEWLDEDALFFVSAYDAITDEDMNEDAVWRKYL